MHYKVRPPHTAILDSLGPPTRPHHPAISESATDAAAGVGVHFEVVVFESPKSVAATKLSGTIEVLCWAPPNGSERFRTVQRPPLSVHEWFACSSGRVPRVVFGAIVAEEVPARSVHGRRVMDRCNQVTTSNFLTSDSPDLRFVWRCTKVTLLWGNFV